MCKLLGHFLWVLDASALVDPVSGPICGMQQISGANLVTRTVSRSGWPSKSYCVTLCSCCECDGGAFAWSVCGMLCLSIVVLAPHLQCVGWKVCMCATMPHICSTMMISTNVWLSLVVVDVGCVCPLLSVLHVCALIVGIALPWHSHD